MRKALPSSLNVCIMSLHDYPHWELKPRKLNSEERENPKQVIDEFFSYAHLPQVRELLWELLKTAITGSYCHNLTRQEREGIIYFYEQLEKLIEAAHLFHSTGTAHLPST